MLALNLYNLVICSVAAVLYVAVNKVEPNPRDAAGLKILIIGVAIAPHRVPAVARAVRGVRRGRCLLA